MTALQKMASSYNDQRILEVHRYCWADIDKSNLGREVIREAENGVTVGVGRNVAPVKAIVKGGVIETMKKL
jgi:hypothetical protein